MNLINYTRKDKMLLTIPFVMLLIIVLLILSPSIFDFDNDRNIKDIAFSKPSKINPYIDKNIKIEVLKDKKIYDSKGYYNVCFQLKFINMLKYPLAMNYTITYLDSSNNKIGSKSDFIKIAAGDHNRIIEICEYDHSGNKKTEDFNIVASFELNNYKGSYCTGKKESDGCGGFFAP